MRRSAGLALAVAVTVSASASAQEAAPAPGLEFAFEEVVKLGPAVDAGDTARGHRRIIPIAGGRFEGPGIVGEVMPGGWDWQLDRADGCTEVKADYFLKTNDGTVINVLNTGTLCRPKPGEAARPAGTHPVFEPPLGKYEYLGQSAYVGTLGMAPASEGPAVLIRFYRLK